MCFLLFESSNETCHVVVRRLVGYSNLKTRVKAALCPYFSCTEAVYEAVVSKRWEFYTDLHQLQIDLQRTKQRRSVSDCWVLFSSFSIWHASSLSVFQKRGVGYSNALAGFQQGTPEVHLPTPSRSYRRVTCLNKASTHCRLSPVHKYMQYAQYKCLHACV